MATQVSYPGIYIQEFTPGAPIQGVATSIGCFIGTAVSGPNNTPIQITSWDEFQSVFGGFISEPSNSPFRSWLAPAVYGFFLNGGTTCYILRVGIGVMASAPLAPSPGVTELVATAIAEGIIGNSISLQVNDSSRLASMLTAASAG